LLTAFGSPIPLPTEWQRNQRPDQRRDDLYAARIS
jgi:hypothetical protein